MNKVCYREIHEGLYFKLLFKITFKGLPSEELNVPFHEHVLLDHYLDEFPQIREIQNFMKLVLNGLSQNAFLTIAEKQETINWYKKYFTDKLDVIKAAINAEIQERQYYASIDNKS